MARPSLAARRAVSPSEIIQARQRWREIQFWMMGSFHRPIYEWKVREWADTDSTLRKAV